MQGRQYSKKILQQQLQLSQDKMRGVIIGGGSIKDYEYIRSLIKKDDYIICADGGYDHAKRMNLSPDVLIGDMDSIADVPKDVESIKYPCDKDFTDGELCVKYAKNKGIDSLLLLAMTSERLDHTINNILMLKGFPKATLEDEDNQIHILSDNLKIKGRKGATLSILPLGGDLEGISTRGLLYALDNGTLFFGESRGNSNVITEDECEISVKKGWGIVVIPR